MSYVHVPVMVNEVLEALNLKADSMVADATAGTGGHLGEMAKLIGISGKIFAFDRDPTSIEFCQTRFTELEFPQIKFVCTNFTNIPESIPENMLLDGLVADLGISSFQLENKERGFSFKYNTPLDMRMNQKGDTTAYELINKSTELELANIIYKYGEEHLSRRIARSIKGNKYIINSGLELAKIIASAYRGKKFKINPATRTFQALRIAVNDELGELEKLLNRLDSIIKPGGRVAIITFHSLEDRIVKHFFKNNHETWRFISKKPIIPKKDEIFKNPRSRSAKLRSVEKIM